MVPPHAILERRYNCRQHRCPHPGCGRDFDRPSKLAAHEKTHEARFVCQFAGCGAAFVLASGLNLHLKEEHPFRYGRGEWREGDCTESLLCMIVLRVVLR